MSDYRNARDYRRHAVVQRPVINLDSTSLRDDNHVTCGWDTCERQGYELYKVRINDAAPGYAPRYINYVFCTERHKMYFVNSTRDCNNLPPGYRLSCM
jgi:hypothetical protein